MLVGYARISTSEQNLDLQKDALKKAGIAHARKHGKAHGRPKTIACKSDEIKRLFKKGLSKFEITRKFGIGRTSVRRLLFD